MAKAWVRVEGLDKLNREFGHLKTEVIKVLPSAVKAGADEIRDAARSRAPVDSGALKSGIISAVTWDKGKSVAWAGAGMDASMNDVFAKYTKDGKRYYYPASIEYGTRLAPAHSFMKPALDNNKGRVKQIVSNRIKRAVEGAGR